MATEPTGAAVSSYDDSSKRSEGVIGQISLHASLLISPWLCRQDRLKAPQSSGWRVPITRSTRRTICSLGPAPEPHERSRIQPGAPPVSFGAKPNSHRRVCAKLLLVVFGVLVTGLATGTSVASSPQGETSTTIDLPGGQKLEGFRGSFSVREDRQRKMSRRITLNYVRLPATTATNGPPIVYLAGGPGASGIDAIRYRSSAFNAMRRFGDVIALDQRGTGASNDLPTCVSHEILSAASSDEQFLGTQRAALTECLAFWKGKGIDLAAYNTRQNALDLEDLRHHLGVDKIVLWGTSYGAHLALAAMRELPNRIDKVVLSSVRGLDQNWKLPATLESYLDRLQQAVDAQPGGRESYGDIRALIRRVHAALEASPVPVTLKDGKGAPVIYPLHRRDMQLLAAALIADPSGAARMLNIYRSLDLHQGPAIDRIPARLLPDHLVTLGQPLSVDCMPILTNIASGISRGRRKVALAQTPTSLFGPYLDQTRQYDGLATELDAGDAFRRTPVSSIPTLVFSGSLDGRTVLEEQHDATIGLRQVTRITVDNAGHNLFDSPTPELLAVLDEFMTRRPVAVVSITVPAPRFAP